MARIFRLLLLLMGWLTTAALGVEPPTDPILRIDAGAHTAKISKIDTDAAGRLVVTASQDKTARLYEIATGQLLRIFRPPIGNGNEGSLYSVALTPDGHILAAGGWTQLGSESGHTIYLFDTVSGRMLQSIRGLSNTIKDLKYSPDGKYLAAALHSKGIRIFLTNGIEINRDEDYSDTCESLHFAPDGRLVTTSLDGYIRFYDQSFKLKAKIKPPNGNQPLSARFSPDGTRIAVAYYSANKIDVFSTISPFQLIASEIVGPNTAGIGTVIWSSDGRTLYAGGSNVGIEDSTLKQIIRRWKYDQPTKGTDLLINAIGTISDLAPLPSGNVLFCAYDGTLGFVKDDGKLNLLTHSPIATYAGIGKNFLISTDGRTVGFGYDIWGKSPAYFTTAIRQLSTDQSPMVGLHPPSDSTPNNDKITVELDTYEEVKSFAAAADGRHFLLGTTWRLICVKKDGKETWSHFLPAGPIWGINIAASGKVAVAAYGDGTIRWHRMSDGAEMLAFFPHADRKRWILWTPSGYYDASPGGEELIGWHLNNGKDKAADFFPASRFRSTYYRPDVIDRVLVTLDEVEALRLANAASGRKRQEVAIANILPAVATILSPADGTKVSHTDLTLRYSVRSPDNAPVTAVKVLIDGRPVGQGRGIDLRQKPAAEDEETIAITIPPRDCEVTLIVENANAASVPATIRLRWGGKAPKAEAFIIQPKLYVLAVGVSDYTDPFLRLGLAAKDAHDFAVALAKQKGLLYADVVTKVLTDDTATKEEILDGLDWLQRETTSKDVAVLFLAGHGVNDPNGLYYYLPQNANLDRLKSTGLPFSDIKNTVASLAGKTLFFVDTCHSGNVMGSRRAVADINVTINELASAENGAIVFASSTGRQFSLEDPRWGNGAFTKALVEGLSGRADYTGKGAITTNMLDLYLSERVKELTLGKQTPTTTKPQTIQDFPIALVRE